MRFLVLYLLTFRYRKSKHLYRKDIKIYFPKNKWYLFILRILKIPFIVDKYVHRIILSYTEGDFIICFCSRTDHWSEYIKHKETNKRRDIWYVNYTDRIQERLDKLKSLIEKEIKNEIPMSKSRQLIEDEMERINCSRPHYSLCSENTNLLLYFSMRFEDLESSKMDFKKLAILISPTLDSKNLLQLNKNFIILYIKF